MCIKQDWIRVILPPKDKKAFFHPSNLIETISNTESLKEIDFGFHPKGRPKYIKGHLEISHDQAKKSTWWIELMLIPEKLDQAKIPALKAPKLQKVLASTSHLILSYGTVGSQKVCLGLTHSWKIFGNMPPNMFSIISFFL